MKKITMDLVITGLRFIAENRDLSTDELADGLEKLGCDWSWDDLSSQFGSFDLINLFVGMQHGAVTCGASVIINMGSRNDRNRYRGDKWFLSTDDSESIYHFVRLVTGDDSFTKEEIEQRHS